MNAERITVDGVEYRANIVYPSRMLRFELQEGQNTGVSLSGREIRDIIGTKYSTVMQAEPDPKYPEDFDALFWALSAPVESHRVSVPLGQKTLEFDAVVRSGEITDHGVSAGFRRWKGLQISFEAIEPQRRP